MLKTIVIGLGNIAIGYDLFSQPSEQIRSVCRALQLHSSFELLSGVDLNKEKRGIFENLYRLESFGCVEKAMIDGRPDLVVVCVPTESHTSILHEILKHSCVRAILCEKPISYEINEASSILSEADKRGVKLFVNYMRRCNPGFIKLRDLIKNDLIKMPFTGFCLYSGGVFNNASHFINLFEFFFGSVNRSEVFASGRRRNEFDLEPEFALHFNNGKVHFQPVEVEHYSLNTFDLCFSNCRVRLGDDCIEIFNRCDRSDVFRGPVLNSDCENNKSELQI